MFFRGRFLSIATTVLLGFILFGLLTFQLVTNLNRLDQEAMAYKPYLRIALLLEGPTYDQGWNSSAFSSLQNLKNKYDFTLEVADNLKPEQIQSSAASFAREGFDLILGHGIIFSKPFNLMAPHFPNTRFVTLNGEAVSQNQTAIQYDMKPAGYLIGKLAGLMSKSHKIGYIVVDQPTEFRQIDGFKQGAKKAYTDTEIVVRKVPDFNDKANAIQAAKELIKEGADVIYTTGDSINLDVIMEAQKANIYAVGYIADQRYIAPNHVLVCLIQDVRQVYTTILEQYLGGNLPSGVVKYGLQEGVNRLSPFGPMVPEEVQKDIINELQQLLHDKK